MAPQRSCNLPKVQRGWPRLLRDCGIARGPGCFRSYLRSTDVVMSSEKSDLGVMSDSGLGVYGLPYLGIFGSTYFGMSSEKIGPGKV